MFSSNGKDEHIPVPDCRKMLGRSKGVQQQEYSGSMMR